MCLSLVDQGGSGGFAGWQGEFMYNSSEVAFDQSAHHHTSEVKSGSNR